MLNKKLTNLIATFLLVIMFVMALTSMKGDSATMDEKAHIPAGYSYVAKQDMRLNPEHPPLLKDLAGLSILLGSKITGQQVNFPEDSAAWQEKLNGQWEFGDVFLYESGNDADFLIFWARLPMILIGLLLAFFVFQLARKTYGQRAAILALILCAFSPTILAHTRYVTTDVGAAAAFFIATYFLLKWINQRGSKNLIVAGLVFGLAMLTKFSLALIVPYFVLLVVVWALVEKIDEDSFRTYFTKTLKTLVQSLAALFLIGLIGMALVWPVYKAHVLNYPVEKQLHDAQENLKTYGNRTLADPVIYMSDKPYLRPYGQYMTGLLMVMQRAVGGNTVYFLGEISREGWIHYFPTVYFLKVPIAFHILTLIALVFALTKLVKASRNKGRFKRIGLWIKGHFNEFALLGLLAVYWIATFKSNLNIGVRHILPTFPVLYVLISGQVVNWLKIPWADLKDKVFSASHLKDKALTFSSAFIKTYFKYIAILILVAWYIGVSLMIYPAYLTFFNQAVGGPEQGYKYVTDSNLDWGQDLKDLSQWVKKENIDHIYIDYFGGGSPAYYLGDKYWRWWGDRDPSGIKSGEYLAVSAGFLQGGRGKPVPGFNEPTGFYNWLNDQELVKVIDYSIFIYRIK